MMNSYDVGSGQTLVSDVACQNLVFHFVECQLVAKLGQNQKLFLQFPYCLHSTVIDAACISLLIAIVVDVFDFCYFQSSRVVS